MDQMVAILEKYNWPKKTNTTEIAVEEIEAMSGLKIPDDYRAFLSKYSGYETQIGEESFKLWDYEIIESFNKGYEIFENLPMTIGIGDNGGGEFIAIEKLNDGKIRVILTPFIDLDQQYHIEIGESFIDFLVRMDRGEKWFK